MGAVTAEHIASFERDGFVVVEDLLSDDELTRFGAAVDIGVEARHSGDDRPVAEKSLYEQSFQQCINLWEDQPDVRPLTFHPAIGGAAARLLGAERLRLWHDQALYKESAGRETDPHQDWPFWPIGPPRQITAWIPFDGSTLASGAMGYSPGSHRLGIAKFSDITRELRPTPHDYFSDASMAPLRWVEAPQGSVVFHHSLTVHQARANITDRTRRVYCIIFFEDGCHRTLPHWHQSLDRQGVEVGEPVRGPVTPVAWPRTSDPLPEPPSDLGAPPQTGYRA